jgi:hypothetical protein
MVASVAFAGSAIEHRSAMNSTQLPVLGAALAPYLALVSVDAWMHEASRQVPRVERWLHYSAGALFLGFVIALIRDATVLALGLFGAFLSLTVWDAVGFHRQLAARERRVHFAAYVALALFVCVWAWLDRSA